MKLLTSGNVVEAPFVTATLGDYTFGVYKNSIKDGKTVARVNAPNYIKQLQIVKINGQVNQYTLDMVYGVTQFTDPNYIEKVLSQTGYGEITLSYGDFNEPSFAFKNETAQITNVKSSVDFRASQLTYQISAISNAFFSKGVVSNFPARRGKPSQIIRSMIINNSYGLKEVFTGMQKPGIIDTEHLIASDDLTVDIEAKQNMSAFDYLNYLVSCMRSITDDKAVYTLNVYDTDSPPMNGCYFTVTKIPNSVSSKSRNDSFEIDVGYPGNPYVIDFQLNNDLAWSILYDYQQKQIQSNNSYLIDRNGEIVPYDVNKLIQNTLKGVVEPEAGAWWNKVTGHPVTASLTIQGLLRPAQLMQYVTINSYFYGQKYIASGLYCITKQTDTINQSGYRTRLDLLRIPDDS